MPDIPPELAPIIEAFQPLMLNRTWEHAVVLLLGAILAPGKRTVSSALRIMGRAQQPEFQNYHRVLNRATWDLRQGSAILLGLLIQTFAPHGRLLLGLDDTIERRWGPKIRARGIYRDPVRSSQSHFVKTSGLLAEPHVVGKSSLGPTRRGSAAVDLSSAIGAILRRS